LAAAFLAAPAVRRASALDVGCGKGALTEPLAELVGAENVVAVDPDASAVAACRARLPQVEVRVCAGRGSCRSSTVSSTSCWRSS
ncbi:MAG: class I SAM-dependent methyltransferase, partial [Thermoleophilaceae bacterium]